MIYGSGLQMSALRRLACRSVRLEILLRKV